MLLKAITLYTVVMVIILIHELGHAVAAHRHGLTVQRVIVGVGPRWLALRVTLFGLPVEFRPVLLGGIIHADEHAWVTDRARAAIAFAGPLANVVLGLPLWITARFLVAGIFPPTLTQPLLLLGGLSVIIGVANLLPVPPLDGGRLLILGLRALGMRSERVENVLTVGGAALIVLAHGLAIGWVNVGALLTGGGLALAIRHMRSRAEGGAAAATE